MRISLKVKLIIASIILGVFPVVCIGIFSLVKFDSFAKDTIAQSYQGLEKQAYNIIQSDVNEHVQKIDPIIKRTFQYTKSLAKSNNIIDYFNAEQSATNNIKNSAINLLKGLIETCLMHYSMTKKQVDTAKYSLGYIIENKGRIYLSTSNKLEWTVLDPMTKQKNKKYLLPEFLIGIEPVYKYYDYEDEFCPIVDDIQEMTGAFCSIFQVVDQNYTLMRIATNLKNKEGKRAIETILPIKTKYGEPNPIILNILEGKAYEGITYEVNGHYISVYKPILNDSGVLLGAFFIGIPSKDTSLEEAVRKSIVTDNGCSFVIDSNGEIVIHSNPINQGKNIFQDNEFNHLKKIFLNADKTRNKMNFHAFVKNRQNHFIVYSYLPKRNWFIGIDGVINKYLDQEIKKSKNLIIQEIQHIRSSTAIKIDNTKKSTINQICLYDQDGNLIVSSINEIQKNHQIKFKNSQLFAKSMSLSNKEIYNAGLTISNQTKEVEMLLTSPVYDNKILKGIIVTHYNWNLMQDLLSQRVYGKTGFALIIDNNGTIVTHPEFSLKSPIKISDKKFGKLSQAVLKKMEKGESGYGKYLCNNIDHYIYFTPLIIGNLNFCFSAIVPVDEFLLLANRIKMVAEYNFDLIFKIIMLFLIICISTALIIGILASRSISDPVSSVVDYAQTVSDGDLSKTLQEHRKDEIGTLIISINAMVKSFRKIVDDVIANSVHLTNSADSMVKTAGKLADNTKKMSNQTNNVTTASEQMTTNISSIASAIEEMSTNIRNVTESTIEMSESMQFVASFVEQMSVSMKDVGNNARKGSHISEEAMKMSTMAINTMKILGQSAEEISSVTSLIKQIAARTEILAVNAAIESSAAGDAGKGFSVVASEITKFADQSAKAAGEIAYSISNVQKNTRQAIDVIDNVSSIIQEMNITSLTINAAVKEQTEASNEIVNHINLARSNATNIANAMNELDIGIREISSNAGYSATLSEEITYNIRGLDRAAMNNNESTQNVNISAVELEGLAGNLQKLVETFYYSDNPQRLIELEN
ncbi:methyl-accepting chemotaxis protein [Candidatus Magnetomorum sp. HK-1]|nr:methyl-accepting chemotaxis protein [Candidatus Magnetomorum sp. HK-1]